MILAVTYCNESASYKIEAGKIYKIELIPKNFTNIKVAEVRDIVFQVLEIGNETIKLLYLERLEVGERTHTKFVSLLQTIWALTNKRPVFVQIGV